MRGYIEQLTAEELLRQTDDPYPVLVLTEAGRRAAEERRGPSGADAGAPAPADTGPTVEPHARRTPSRGRTSTASCSSACARVRLQIARERGVPPYVIFHDTTLRELARLKPTIARRICSRSTASARARQISWARCS